MRISDPAWNETEPPCYLEPDLEHPLFMEAVDQALALCSEDSGPAHLKLVLEWSESAKKSIIADETDLVEEHASVKMLRSQALQGGAPLTLEECLRDYTGAETLSDAWRCPHCQQYQPVVKTLDMWSLPDILIVHFKRFRQHSIRGGNSTKLTTMVDFPVYGFDMSPHLANKRNTSSVTTNGINDNDNIISISNGWSSWKRTRKQSNSNDNMYDLYAVCYHHGTDLETGHYTAACKNPYDQNWYLYDDAKVVNLNKDVNDVTPLLVNNSAYILFYQRRNGSNNSSAASTSSVGSGNDHWVSRMPKFTPPKLCKQPEKTVSIKDDVKNTDKEDTKKEGKVDEVVALRNSQNTLYSSRKSLEIKVSENTRNSPTLSLNLNRSSSEISPSKRPVFTTSIYINSTSTGNVDENPMSPKTSPVLSNLRTEGVQSEQQPSTGIQIRGEIYPGHN
ncbi:hypothetical protein GWI33_014542 [Rhynchophorus ferrugineus]|uniref:ubiquitinyl hydrolase 1 n=1 Tax=Rhynchophorus ferrugineus TaxID=354439 RepID=A0A834I769_RHYFE|nr:hypothetical protein GWI33_014542 [Rhynchophorus ferrugineus]